MVKSLNIPRPLQVFDPWLRHVLKTGPLTLERARAKTTNPKLKAARTAFLKRGDKERILYNFEHPWDFHRREPWKEHKSRDVRLDIANLRKKNLPYYLWELSKKRSDVRHGRVPFTIKPSDIEVPALCPILKKPLTRGENRQKGPMSPTVHLVKPRLGYVPGNVSVLSWVAADYLARLDQEVTVEGVTLAPNMDPEDRWKLTCPHGRELFTSGLSKAQGLQKKPGHWCPKCRRGSGVTQK